MSENIYEFNADELVEEMNCVMRRGISNILKEFIDRYELLEKTHKQIMNLPSVLNELKLNQKQEVNEDINVSFKKYENKEINLLNSKIDQIEKKMDTIYSLFDKYLLEKNQSNEPPQMKSSIIATCENENIKMEIKEVDKEINVESYIQEEELEELEEEEDEEEELVEEEDIKEEELEELEELEEEEDEEEEEEEEIETEASSDNEEEEKDKEDEVLAPHQSLKNVEEEEEFYEIEIDDITYYTNNEENGFLYTILDDDVGDKVGYIKDGEPFFYADEN